MNNGLWKYYFNTITRIFIPGVLFCALGACNNNPDDIRALTSRGSKELDRAEDVTLIYSKDGKIKSRLFAHEFIKNDNAKPPYIDMNHSLKAEFYDDSGRVENVLTADSSRYYIAEGNVIVWDSVQIISKKGEQLNTSELIWNERIQKFYNNEKPVRITTATEILQGNGLEANSDFTWYRIISPKGTVQVNKGELPQ
jgi:LPS export ABC transporter protein LptC